MAGGLGQRGIEIVGASSGCEFGAVVVALFALELRWLEWDCSRSAIGKPVLVRTELNGEGNRWATYGREVAKGEDAQ